MTGVSGYIRRPRDFLDGTRHLDLKTRAIYSDLIDIQYNLGRPVPLDPEYLLPALGLKRVASYTKSIAKLLREPDKLVKIIVNGIECVSNPRVARELPRISHGKTNGELAEKSRRTRREVAEKSRVLQGSIKPDQKVTELSPTPTPKNNGGGNARAREAVEPKRDTRWGEVYARLETILNWPKPFDGSRIHAWLAAGADPDLDVYPTVLRLCRDAIDRKVTINGLKYFENAIICARADRTTPPEEGKHANGTHHVNGTAHARGSRRGAGGVMDAVARVLARQQNGSGLRRDGRI